MVIDNERVIITRMVKEVIYFLRSLEGLRKFNKEYLIYIRDKSSYFIKTEL